MAASAGYDSTVGICANEPLVSLRDTDGTQSASPVFSGTKGERHEEEEGTAVTADGCKVSQQDSVSFLDGYSKVYHLFGLF